MKSLALVLVACGSTPKPVTDLPPLPGDPPRDEPHAAPSATGCIPSGVYRVTVELAGAKITQGDTGMAEGDTTWCESMLTAVPAQLMSAMRIAVDDGAVAVEWPPGHMASASLAGACQLEISAQPMSATLTFANGKGSGTTTYTVGTQHAGDTCTATNAKLSVEPAPH